MENRLKGEKFFQEAEELRAKNHFLKAVKKYREALLIFKKEGLKEKIAGVYLCMGDAQRGAGLFSPARRSYQSALSRLNQKNNYSLYAETLVGLALCIRIRGRHDSALKLLQQAAQLYKINSDPLGQAFVFWAKGGTLRFKGRLREAKKNFLRAEEIFRQERYREGRGYALCGLGGLTRVRGDFNSSLDYYRKANRIFRSREDLFGIAYSYCGLANAWRMRGRNRQAASYFKQAKKHYRQIGEQLSYAYTLWGEGTLLKLEGKWKQALKNFETSARIFKEKGDPRGLIYVQLGKIELKLLSGETVGKAITKVKRLLKRTRGYGFAVEEYYAMLLLDSLERLKNPCSQKEISRELRQSSRKLGIKIDFTTIPPYNIP